MDNVIGPLCDCEPSAADQRREGGSVVMVCRTCGASAIALSAGLPAFVRDRTTYEVSVELSPGLLRSAISLLKAKTGKTTPQLVALARDHTRLVLIRDQAILVHYQLREYAAASLPVRVVPPYPHDFMSNR